jgi:putative Mg2+ transporter-C (MgtC) family protein
MDMIMEWEIAARLALAGIFGGIIGYERQAQHKSAGLRTHVLVCIGSCLIMVLSLNIYYSVQGLTNADPTRLAAQVVSGIGFLGAGSIMKEGPTVRGLTTAASLWVVSGVGLAVGSGYYMSAFTTTGLVFLTLTILSRVEKKDCSMQLVSLVVTSVDVPGQIGQIGSILGHQGISIRDIKIDEHDHLLTLSFLLQFPPNGNVSQTTADISNIHGITSIRREC